MRISCCVHLALYSVMRLVVKLNLQRAIFSFYAKGLTLFYWVELFFRILHLGAIWVYNRGVFIL
ncbi:hypothetical protein AT1219_130038 [Vibrio alginolyticus]